jgi:hypothetical protein
MSNSRLNIEAGFHLSTVPDFYNPTRCTIYSTFVPTAPASTETPSATTVVCDLEAKVTSASALVEKERTAVAAARIALAENNKDSIKHKKVALADALEALSKALWSLSEIERRLGTARMDEAKAVRKALRDSALEKPG